MVFEVALENMNSWADGNSNMENETYMGVVEEVNRYVYIGLKSLFSSSLLSKIEIKKKHFWFCPFHNMFYPNNGFSSFK